MSLIDIFKKKTASSNIYDTLTQKQKLAAMNLMVVFGGSCSGTEYELDKSYYGLRRSAYGYFWK